nr:uncharacterized protein LOC127347059 [Lolium perenne]
MLTVGPATSCPRRSSPPQAPATLPRAPPRRHEASSRRNRLGKPSIDADATVFPVTGRLLRRSSPPFPAFPGSGDTTNSTAVRFRSSWCSRLPPLSPVAPPPRAPAPADARPHRRPRSGDLQVTTPPPGDSSQ